MWGRHHLRWSEIESFLTPTETIAQPGWRSGHGIGIVMKDGRHLRSTLWSAAKIDRADFADETVRALQELREKHG